MGNSQCQHEYVLTTNHHQAEFLPALENLARELETSERNNKRYFEFEWTVGHLIVQMDDTTAASNGESASGGVFAPDAPSYRVVAGENSRVLRNWLEDFLTCSHQEITKIRSVVFSGSIHQGDIMDLARILVVEGDLPVESIEALPWRSVSPLGDWNDVRIGGVLSGLVQSFLMLLQAIHALLFQGLAEARTLLYVLLQSTRVALLGKLRRKVGTLSGIAHMAEDRTRFAVSHHMYENERLLIYNFAVAGSRFRVLDPPPQTEKA